MFRISEHKGENWLERASTVPATRLDILALEEKLESELKNRKAKTFGVCPIRREIYDDLFGTNFHIFNYIIKTNLFVKLQLIVRNEVFYY